MLYYLTMKIIKITIKLIIFTHTHTQTHGFIAYKRICDILLLDILHDLCRFTDI